MSWTATLHQSDGIHIIQGVSLYGDDAGYWQWLSGLPPSLQVPNVEFFVDTLRYTLLFEVGQDPATKTVWRNAEDAVLCRCIGRMEKTLWASF